MTGETMTLEEVQTRKAALKKELEELQKIELAILNERSGIKVGDRVRSTFGPNNGAEYVVGYIDHGPSHGNKKPWVSGYRIKKDGEPGSAVKHLYYEWEKVDGVSS